MRTVNELREELAKFPDDAVCWAYEGEVKGIVIAYNKELWMYPGVIYCSEEDDAVEAPTELLPDKALVLKREGKRATAL